jgi:hypothetical protein
MPSEPAEKAPEGVDEKLWKANKDLQKQMREQIEKEEAERVAEAQKAAGTPQTTTTRPSMTVAEAGEANEKASKKEP